MYCIKHNKLCFQRSKWIERNKIKTPFKFVLNRKYPNTGIQKKKWLPRENVKCEFQNALVRSVICALFIPMQLAEF